MCVACFTTAQLATVGAVSARWWWVNKRHPAAEVDEHDAGGDSNPETTALVDKPGFMRRNRRKSGHFAPDHDGYGDPNQPCRKGSRGPDHEPAPVA